MEYYLSLLVDIDPLLTHDVMILPIIVVGANARGLVKI
jgi:hypothetical protein